VFSSNDALYGDMSARTNAVYRQFAPDVEVYSIDESFLDVTAVRPRDRVTLGRDLRATVLRWTGIPTCVGIGPTKTLAKLANHIAKHRPDMAGICDLTEPGTRAQWLGLTKLEEVWGIGPASAPKLRALGCDTAADVAALDPRPARKALTVVGERIIYELRALPCLDLETVAPTRKGCAVTRSFSSRVEDRDTMEQAIATHAARLGEKLRRGGLGTDHVTVFFHMSEHDTGSPQRSVSTTVTLPEVTSDTLVLAKAATWALRRIWRDGFRYSKAGVVTVDLVPLAGSQRALIGGFNREGGRGSDGRA
jgi:DNA polymerase V